MAKSVKRSKSRSKKLDFGKTSKRLRAFFVVIAVAIVGIVALTLSYAETAPPLIDGSVTGNVLQAESAALSGSASVRPGEGSNGSFVQFDDPVLTATEKADINTQIGRHYGCGLQTYPKLAKLSFRVKAGTSSIIFHFKAGSANSKSLPTSPAAWIAYGAPGNNPGHADYPVMLFRGDGNCPDAVSLQWTPQQNFTWIDGGPSVKFTSCNSKDFVDAIQRKQAGTCYQSWDSSSLSSYYTLGNSLSGGVSLGDMTITVVAGGGLKLDAIAFAKLPIHNTELKNQLSSIDWSRNDVQNPVTNTSSTANTSSSPTSPAAPSSITAPTTGSNGTSAPATSTAPSETPSLVTTSEGANDPAQSVLNQSQSGRYPNATAIEKKAGLIKRLFINPINRAWHALNPFD